MACLWPIPPSAVTVTDNLIADNGDFGVSLEAGNGSNGSSLSNVALDTNTLTGNANANSVRAGRRREQRPGT